MIIDSSQFTKAFWVGAFVVCLTIYGVGKIVLGLYRHKKINFDRYDVGDAFEGMILTIICIGWWFAP